MDNILFNNVTTILSSLSSACRNSSDEELMMELMTVNLKLNFNC